MSYNFRPPNITATTPEGKLQQMQSFLYQTVEQLNWAMNTMQTGAATGGTAVQSVAGGNSSQEQTDSLSTFNDIKSLIIKSAEIVNSYYETINARLAGEYVAQSDFGTYTELTEQQILANSTAIDQVFTNLQQIITDIEGMSHTLIEVNAHIRSGILYYDEKGVPVYGVEIGQKTQIDGEEVFNQFARFTAEKLSFFDSNGVEVAYISDQKLYISHVEVTGTFTQGGFIDITLPDKSVVTKWIGVGL